MSSDMNRGQVRTIKSQNSKIHSTSDPALEVIKVYKYPIVAVKNSISSHILLNYQM